MTIIEVIQGLISIATLVGLIIVFYRSYSDPDQKAKSDIRLIEERCQLKHDTVDSEISEIKNDIRFIKENHLKHIERDMSDVKGDIKSILAVLRINNK